MNPDKEIRADAKLKKLPPEMLETLWRLRYPEEGGSPLTYEAILVALPELCGVSSSLGALSEFYSWLRLKRRIEGAAERAAQVRMELAKDSTITPDDLERIAQTLFTAETLEGGDVKSFVALATLRLNRQRVDQDERKLRILEAKAAQADKAAATVNDEALTEEEKAARIKQIFRMG